MRKFLVLLFFLMLSVTAQADPYYFNGVWVDVEAWCGTGANESILVVDWNRLDNGEATISESHAFGYRWDGGAYESDMLNALNDAGILAVTTSYGGAFLDNIGYDDVDDNEVHMHIEEGSWNLASTSDPYAEWGTWGNSEWDFNTSGLTSELLANGQFEGINAIMWFGSLPPYADDQLDIPLTAPPVPLPGAVLLLGSGLFRMMALRKKSKVKK
ncbi:hypothetical protein [Desulfobacca acetoxidans]|uniref:EppA_BapA family protein n=1 Tax=Desulfobacca acetoxidans (strain ATCC 700848 / DSM 11109 / ASRB2) TaxID=880072 RepID=F2NF97_DESAR|nr:hypothetical protein [Desulfobacca acetoxidans]AEB08652.1 EppA_BapA family protein [Desulfobacca acetoxidans DSM 11109]